jgi:hypothetical protein
VWVGAAEGVCGWVEGGRWVGDEWDGAKG